MSLAASTRRLRSRCVHANHLIPPAAAPSSYIQHQQRRTAIFDYFTRGKAAKKQVDSRDSKPKPNPVLEEYQRKQAEIGPEPVQQQVAPQAGDIGTSFIFEDDRRASVQQEQDAAAAGQASKPKRDPSNIDRVVDPDPNARERWERKKVIQMVRKDGRLTKAQYLKRTEREHLMRSHNFKTSVKKLGMLARQIAGKRIDDAITQMRFSKKKVAQDVLKQLEMARDEAIVSRGMGLGKVRLAGDDAAELDSPSVLMAGAAAQRPSRRKGAATTDALQIQLKDGRRHQVVDQNQIYVDQAWVGRGPFGRLPEYRARGKTNMLRPPWTSMSVLLKEEATRVREWAEREEKRKKQRLSKVWTHLPDRPVQWQRPYYTF